MMATTQPSLREEFLEAEAARKAALWERTQAQKAQALGMPGLEEFAEGLKERIKEAKERGESKLEHIIADSTEAEIERLSALNTVYTNKVNIADEIRHSSVYRRIHEVCADPEVDMRVVLTTTKKGADLVPGIFIHFSTGYAESTDRDTIRPRGRQPSTAPQPR